MTYSIVCAALWVLAATGVAFLPMTWQFKPGFLLLILAPVLIIWLGMDHGWFVSVGATLGFVSMFRRPLAHYWRKWRGIEELSK